MIWVVRAPERYAWEHHGPVTPAVIEATSCMLAKQYWILRGSYHVHLFVGVPKHECHDFGGVITPPPSTAMRLAEMTEDILSW